MLTANGFQNYNVVEPEDETALSVDEAVVQQFLRQRAIADKQAPDVLLWHNPARMLDEIERRHREENPGIMCIPYHDCFKSCCTLKPLVVILYRMRHKDMDTTELIHVCFDKGCKHIKKGHECENPDKCPHRYSYSTIDTQLIRHLFYCNHSGKLHICGEKCNSRYTESVAGGQHVCPLTGVVLGSILQGPLDDYTPLHLRLTDGNDGGDYGSSFAEEGGALMVLDKMIVCKRGSRQALSEEHLLIQREQMVERVFLDLMCSQRRQEDEINRILHDYAKLDTDIARMSSRRNLRGNRLLAMSMFRSKRPKSMYFKIVPVIKDMQARVGRAMYTICGERPGPNEVAYKQRIASLLRKTPPIDQHQKNMKYMQHMAKLIARTTVTIYNKLVTAAAGTEGSLIFRNMFVFLMYMMRQGHSIPMATNSSAGQTSVITVIPKMDIMLLLPPQRTLDQYDSVRNLAVLPRSNTLLLNTIMNIYNKAAQNHKLHDLEIDMQEIEATLL